MHAKSVELRNVSKRFGGATAVRTLDLRVEPGEFLTLLGPSGCGKTTLLRMIAGLEAVTDGTIFVGEADVTELPPHRRDTSIMFQDYALFPHKTVAENVSYGLKMQGVARAKREAAARDWLARVGLPEMGARLPHQLSGGQRQRVALARSLIINPGVLLLDEPLGALDANLRKQMQGELRRLHQEVGLTFVYVTHDQEEALAMSDRIAVMRNGTIEQLSPPQDGLRSPGDGIRRAVHRPLQRRARGGVPGGRRIRIVRCRRPRHDQGGCRPGARGRRTGRPGVAGPKPSSFLPAFRWRGPTARS